MVLPKVEEEIYDLEDNDVTENYIITYKTVKKTIKGLNKTVLWWND